MSMNQHQIDQARRQNEQEKWVRDAASDPAEVLAAAKPGAEQELAGLCGAMAGHDDDHGDEEPPPAWADDERT